MKPWLTAIQRQAMEDKNVKLYKFGSAIQKIMKEFIIWLKEGKKDLMHCSYAHFKDWYSNVGLFTMYGKYQMMDWEADFENSLFSLYSACAMELEVRQKQTEAEITDEEQSTSLLSRNTKNISTLSTTARIPDRLAGASMSKGSENTQLRDATNKTTKDGKTLRRVQFQREKCASRKRRYSSESDPEYQAGDLFHNSQVSVEDESETELNRRISSTEDKSQDEERTSDSEGGLNDEDFASMVGNLAQAHCLVSNTGKISQNILIKDTDQYISMSTPGESGQMLMKLELYPFKECVKLNKTEYWRKRTFSSLTVLSSKTCPVYNLQSSHETSQSSNQASDENKKESESIKLGLVSNAVSSRSVIKGFGGSHIKPLGEVLVTISADEAKCDNLIAYIVPDNAQDIVMPPVTGKHTGQRRYAALQKAYSAAWRRLSPNEKAIYQGYHHWRSSNAGRLVKSQFDRQWRQEQSRPHTANPEPHGEAGPSNDQSADRLDDFNVEDLFPDDWFNNSELSNMADIQNNVLEMPAATQVAQTGGEAEPMDTSELGSSSRGPGGGTVTSASMGIAKIVPNPRLKTMHISFSKKWYKYTYGYAHTKLEGDFITRLLTPYAYLYIYRQSVCISKCTDVPQIKTIA
ncbi:hypothetical protein ACJJTC_013816 [Scirpophaga incertulas]